jgi:hypothetical protein
VRRHADKDAASNKGVRARSTLRLDSLNVERALREESSFSEEKEAKRLLFLPTRDYPWHVHHRGSGGDIKVFCFFSSEKKSLP